MADYDILIGGDANGDGALGVYKGTNVKDSPETQTKSTNCFDEVVTDGASEIGGTLEIEKLSYDSMQDYIDIETKLLEMRSVPTMVTTVEVIRFKDEAPYTIYKNYLNCIVAGNDYESKPAEKSTRNLKFNYSKMVQNIKDSTGKMVEIKLPE